MKIYTTTSAITIAHRFEDFQNVSIEIFDSMEFELKTQKVDERKHSECVIIASIANANDYVELLLLLSTLRCYKSIKILLLYMFYARQDADKPFQSFGAKTIQNSIEFANVTEIIHINLHSNHFNCKNRALSVTDLFVDDILKKFDKKDVILVSPDGGSVDLVAEMSKKIDVELVFCSKYKENNNMSFSARFNKCSGKHCIIIDDMIDSGRTVCYTADILNKHNALSVSAYCVHGVLSQGVDQMLDDSCIKELVVTDSICRLTPDSQKIRRLSLFSYLRDFVDGML